MIQALLAPLLANGLSLLSNAVLVKGEKWLKDKTGVDLAQSKLSNEDLVKLREFEMVNHLELKKLQMADNALSVELEKAYLADTQSAREMQSNALKQDDLFAKRFIYYFAFFWAFVTTAYIACITFLDIPTENVRYADTILGFLLGTIVGQILSFFFGSSRSSQSKDEIIGGVVKNVTRR